MSVPDLRNKDTTVASNGGLYPVVYTFEQIAKTFTMGNANLATWQTSMSWAYPW